MVALSPCELSECDVWLLPATAVYALNSFSLVIDFQ